jgi:hypothetical protein
VQELRKIEARFLDLPTDRVVFPPKQAKGKKYHRVIYLTDRAKEILARLAEAHPTGRCCSTRRVMRGRRTRSTARSAASNSPSADGRSRNRGWEPRTPLASAGLASSRSDWRTRTRGTGRR